MTKEMEQKIMRAASVFAVIVFIAMGVFALTPQYETWLTNYIEWYVRKLPEMFTTLRIVAAIVSFGGAAVIGIAVPIIKKENK